MVNIQQTIIVGLGPVGRAVLEHFKRRTLQVYGELPALKLLALDVPQPSHTVMGGAAATPVESLLSPTEIIELPLDDVIDAPQRAKNIYPWLPERVITYGPEWYQTRAASRLALHMQFKDLYNFLEYHFHQLSTVEVRDEMRDKGFDITTERNEASLIIISALGEPVGSGLLLDVAYMVRHLYGRVGIQTASTAVLFMPPMAPSDPTAEACAYAALKELNAVMDHQVYTCRYPDLTIESDVPPFNRGCFLVDTRNEKGLTLRNQEEAIHLVGEWLFRTILTPIKARIDEFLDVQGTEVRIQDRVAAFSSLGLATYMLPVDDLVEWNANRLSNEIIVEHFIKGESFAKVSARLTDFYNNNHLRPDNLMGDKLRLGSDGKPIKMSNDYISRLKTVPHNQITAAVQATVAAIGREMLPGLKRQIEQNAKNLLEEINESIEQEIASILKEWPSGGLSLASQFTVRLRDDSARFSEALRRREAAFQGQNQQLVNHLNQLGPALKNAVDSIPSIPIILLTLLGGLLAPLILSSIWIWKGMASTGSLGSILALLAILGIWAFFLISTVFAYIRTVNEIDEIRDQYVTRLNGRFETELNLALVQSASTLYPDVTNIATSNLERLDTFTGDLNRLVRTFKNRLETTPLCGERDFASQRSVLTSDLIDELYSRFLGPGQSEARLTPLIERSGSLVEWRNYSQEDVEARLLSYGRQVFEGMHELRVEDLLNRQLTSRSVAEARIRELQDKAAPLWTYDPFILGQTYSLADQTFLGMETVAATDLKQQFERVNPSTAFEATGDRHSLIVTILRQGMPLFGLRRMREFRQHYLDSLRSRRQPLHLDEAMGLIRDIMPSTIERIELDPSTTFAVGLALELFKQQEDGSYIAETHVGKLVGEFVLDKVESVILLGADEKLWSSMANEIQTVVAGKGTKETGKDLSKFLSATEISPWEQVCIENYMGLLQG